MKKLTYLHEEFINNARRPMSFGKLPISPKESDVPLFATERWTTSGDPKALVKNYVFSSDEQRNDFVMSLLSYETKVQHKACLTVEENKVHVSLYTKNINVVTEIDREYAAFCDTLYKDIVYSSPYDGQQSEYSGPEQFESFDE
jgi:pterin-4a-carbinolamine dehydratase